MTDRYPTHEDVATKIEQFTAEGVITEAGLLRIALIVSRLTTYGIDEESIVRTLVIAYPQALSVIKQAMEDIQADPMLAVKVKE